MGLGKIKMWMEDNQLNMNDATRQNSYVMGATTLPQPANTLDHVKVRVILKSNDPHTSKVFA